MTDATKLLEEARRLRERGYSYARIARRLGVSQARVWRAVNLERARAYERGRRASKRAWEQRARAACPRCGAPMMAGSASPSKRPAMCRACRAAESERRRQAVAFGYRAGFTPREIAHALGVSVAAVCGLAWRMRREGIDVPHAPMGSRAHRRVRS